MSDRPRCQVTLSHAVSTVSLNPYQCKRGNLPVSLSIQTGNAYIWQSQKEVWQLEWACLVSDLISNPLGRSLSSWTWILCLHSCRRQVGQTLNWNNKQVDMKSSLCSQSIQHLNPFMLSRSNLDVKRGFGDFGPTRPWTSLAWASRLASD
jgi:hypothetical protein